MAMQTERNRLNGLIESCRDAARGFGLAADHADEPVLKTFLSEMAQQRQAFADELAPHAQRLGGYDASGGTASGALHRAWMTVKDAATNYDEGAIVAEAVRGEAAAANAYAAAMQGVLPPDARPVVERQYESILASQRRLDEFYLRATARP